MSREARKKARKDRNRSHVLCLGESRNRWQGDVAIRFGPHPDAVWKPKFSGVKFDVDLSDQNPTEGIPELTALALAGPADPSEAN